MGEVIPYFIVGLGLCAIIMMVMERWPARKPKHITAAIEELTAHKLQHNTWMEGQRLAMAWWEEQCACPSVKDYRQIPGCKRIAQGTGVCVEWEKGPLDTLVMLDMALRADPTVAYNEYLRAMPPAHRGHPVYDPTYRVR